MPVEHQVWKVQDCHVVFVNGEWQGCPGTGFGRSDVADTCPEVWCALDSAAEKGWILVSISEGIIRQHDDSVAKCQMLYLRRSVASDDPDLDKAELEEVVEGFSPGGEPEQWLAAMSAELQSALRRRNSATSLRQLVAFGISTQGFQIRSLARLSRSIFRLLVLIALLLAVLVYKAW